MRTITIIRITLLLLGTIMAIDGLVLFALLKFNFGTIVPFVIGIIFLIHAISWQTIQRALSSRWQLKRAWQSCWLLFIVWLISFVLFVGTVTYKINAEQPLKTIDAIIVLGAGVNGDNPTPALASRLDKAASIWQAYPAAHIITSGGVGIGRTRSEASVMANYLITQHAIDPQNILLEEKSTSTETNLLFSKALLLETHNLTGVENLDNANVDTDIIDKNAQLNSTAITHSVAIVTNDFHTVRAKAIANKQGYTNVYAAASRTPLSICANAWFREYFAFISSWILGEY